MMGTPSTVLVCVLAAFACVHAQHRFSQDCVWTDEDGHEWDLSQLRKGGMGWHVTPHHRYDYEIEFYFDFCGPLEERPLPCQGEVDADGVLLTSSFDQIDVDSNECDGSLGAWELPLADTVSDNQPWVESSLRSEYEYKGVVLRYSNRQLEHIETLNDVVLELHVICSQFPNYPRMEVYHVEDASDPQNPLDFTRTIEVLFFAPFEGCPYNPEFPRPPVLADCEYISGLGLFFDMSSLYSEDLDERGKFKEPFSTDPNQLQYDLQFCGNLRNPRSNTTSSFDVSYWDNATSEVKFASIAYWDDYQQQPSVLELETDGAGRPTGLMLRFSNGRHEDCPNDLVHTYIFMFCRNMEEPRASEIFHSATREGCSFIIAVESTAACFATPTSNALALCGNVQDLPAHRGVEMRLCQSSPIGISSGDDPCQNGLGGDDDHFCYTQDGVAGRAGICITDDFFVASQSDVLSCSNGEVQIQPLDEDGMPTSYDQAICVPQEWYDYLCCAHFGDWHCPDTECGDALALPASDSLGGFKLCNSVLDCIERGTNESRQDPRNCFHGDSTTPGFCRPFATDFLGRACTEDETMLRTIPATAIDGDGVCVPSAWKEYMCCRFPSEYECHDQCGSVQNLSIVEEDANLVPHTFTLCATDADCRVQGSRYSRCYTETLADSAVHSGRIGFCARYPSERSTFHDEDCTSLEGRTWFGLEYDDSEVLCVPEDWKQYMCCMDVTDATDRWRCVGDVFPNLEPDFEPAPPSKAAETARILYPILGGLVVVLIIVVIWLFVYRHKRRNYHIQDGDGTGVGVIEDSRSRSPPQNGGGGRSSVSNGSSADTSAGGVELQDSRPAASERVKTGPQFAITEDDLDSD